ncbi:MAG: hypothetical protein VX955_08435 [Pseudomonadota bacterium]|nr:hypothetical protein [Pseudomonadota bacterium]
MSNKDSVLARPPIARPRALSACGWAAGTPGGIDPRNRRPHLPAGDVKPVIQLDRFY